MKISLPSLARGAAASSLVALAACGGFGSDSIIGGTLSGLATGATVVLSDNGADNLTLAANGSFVFATKVAASGAYSVAVVTQPTGQTCSVANATGKVNNAGSDINNIDVACVTTSSVVATVTGLPANTTVIAERWRQYPDLRNEQLGGVSEIDRPGTALHSDDRRPDEGDNVHSGHHERRHSCHRNRQRHRDVRYFRLRSSPPM